MSRRLSPSFYTGKTALQLARSLLGVLLVHETDEGIVSGFITETEAYTEDDPASHTFGGVVTERNRTMFLRAGYLYVYFIYGRYFCCNVTAERGGRGAAVLLRAVLPDEGSALMRKRRGGARALADGPGKLCQAFGIGREHDGVDLTEAQSPLYLSQGRSVRSVQRTARIGIRHATEKQWRYVVDAW